MTKDCDESNDATCIILAADKSALLGLLLNGAFVATLGNFLSIRIQQSLSDAFRDPKKLEALMRRDGYKKGHSPVFKVASQCHILIADSRVSNKNNIFVRQTVLIACICSILFTKCLVIYFIE
jgi:hypothetical protein